MRGYNLKIAGYNIRLETSENGPDLVPEDRFLRSVCNSTNYDILIKVHSGTFKLSEDAERVFVAPYVVEIHGYKIKRSDNFWSVYKHNYDLFIVTNFPDSTPKKRAVLKFSLFAGEWDLWLEGAGDTTDPLEYPLDGLILYYLTAINDNIMMHASGILHADHGYLFSGISGKGKTTLARLWENLGAKVIHDDRLIIRNIEGAYRMFSIPVKSSCQCYFLPFSPAEFTTVVEQVTNGRIVTIRQIVYQFMNASFHGS